MQAERIEILALKVEHSKRQASGLREDAARYLQLEAEAERDLFAHTKPEEAQSYETARVRLSAFRAGRRDCEKRATEAEAETLRLQAELESAKAEPEPVRARVVRALEVEALGVEHSQYFQGAGAEDYEEVYVGCGNSEREALSDALEQLAQSGSWRFEPAQGFPSEPDAGECSPEDEVTKAEESARQDAVGSSPEPRYRVALYPFNGSGPVVLREGLSLSDAANWGQEYATKAERRGLEVSDLLPKTCARTSVALAQWELQYPDSGVSDAEGILGVELEPKSAQALEDFERASERYDEEPSDLSYRVALRVSSAPESEGEHFGLPIYEDSDGKRWAFASTAEEGERAALEAARESLWAFQLQFLSDYLAPELREPEARKALERAQRDLCEGFGPIVRALLGSRLEEAMSAAVRIDGPGHFLSPFDGSEVRDSDGACRYAL